MSYRLFTINAAAFLLATSLAGCHEGGGNSTSKPIADPVAPDEGSVFGLANGCYAVSISDSGEFIVAVNSDRNYQVIDTHTDSATRFRLQAADLGTYLLYDQDKSYLTSDGFNLTRQSSLRSDTSMVEGEVVIDDQMRSEGEWQISAAPDGQFNLLHLQSGHYLSEAGTMAVAAEAAAISFVEQTGCVDFPELDLNASGEITVTEFDDGAVFGFVDAHSHLLTNFAFGGGGVFHGAPFHRLGVEHALADCDLVHGEEGRRDFMGASFGESSGTTIVDLIPAFIAGELPDKDHDTDGYPDFSSWPDAPRSATHQVQYYKWLERAHLSGLRLLVQHATSTQALCELAVGIGSQPKRYDCNDMMAVDRIIDETYAMERYIDALSGGPGKGWFRVVLSPAEAREQIKAGKLAVVLGIEVSDPLNCFLVPFGEFSQCTKSDVTSRLDQYHERGVRALFPVHKFDNAFTAGDGDRRTSEIGNFGHSGHYASFELCSENLLSFSGGFDRGGLSFANLNQPRDVFDVEPPFDVSGFAKDPLGTLLANFSLFGGGPLEGEYCQSHGLTDLGEFLLKQMMMRGMIIEVDHFPRKSYQRAYEILQEFDYPAAGTHGRHMNGLLYELGGTSTTSLTGCRSATTPAASDDSFQERIALIRDKGGYPAEGFGFDLNGFAGAPGPRFGEMSRCSELQTDDGINYPFTSYAGDITFEQPVIGNRTLDFNTEGMVHVGLIAELIEDVRRDGVTDEELEPLFKSAEAYLRMWERAEARAVALKN